MLRYQTAETVLARLHGADPEVQVTTLRGRLKHLFRLGLPRGPSPGRGAKVWYDDKQFFEWVLALEMEQAGADPTAAVKFISEHFDVTIWPRVERALEGTETGYLAIYPTVMSSRAWPSKRKQPLYEVEWIYPSEVALWASRLSGDRRRAILLNIGALVREYMMLRVSADTANPASAATKPKRGRK